MHPLVLLHGFTGSPASFKRLKAELSKEMEVATPLLAGHGEAPVSVSNFAEEVERLAMQIGHSAASPWHLAGYSLGGRLALGLALEHPKLVASLTLISAHPGLGNEEDRRARLAQDEEQARLLEQQGLPAFIEKWKRQPLFASQHRLAIDELTEQERIRSSHKASGLALALRTLGLGAMPDYWPKMAQLTIPLCVITGELDSKFMAIGERISNAAPSVRWICIPGAGHNLVLEAPRRLAEEIQRIVTPSTN